MQNIVIDQPYEFVPPCRGAFWPRILKLILPTYLNRVHGVESVELLGVDRLQKSVTAGHGIMLTPNHCRPPDPMVMAHLGYAVGRPIHVMASWHLFKQSAVQRWLLPKAGAFSV